MNNDEKMVLMQLRKYERTLFKTNDVQRWSKKIQQRFDGLIPDKVHESLAKALEKTIKAFIEGLNLLPKQHLKAPDLSSSETSLKRLTEESREIIQLYKKIASAEGAGTGFGGLIASTIDFPALISIKLKLLQELTILFGHRLENFEERLFVLKIFQLQFTGTKNRRKLWNEIRDWEFRLEENEWESWDTFDWTEFYLDYKQSIELRKLLQVIPGFGAIVGAVANYSFLDDLGETALRCLQLRYLQEHYGKDVYRS